jgi:CRP/FNR family transcriptional regulator, cyclic AMP receptor protein
MAQVLDPTELQRFLAGIPIFGGLEDATLARIIAMLGEHQFAPGTEVCKEGEHGRAMYVVGQGEVVVRRGGPAGHQIRMVRLGPGEFFGEMTLIDPQPRSATVVVDQKAVIYSLTNRDLYQLYQEDMPGYVMVLQNLCRELSRRLRRADERICEIAEQASAEDVTQIAPSPFAAFGSGER